MIDDIKPAERPIFTPLPNGEVNRIAQMHAKNGFSIKATAKQLGMTYMSFTQLICTHENLRIAICHYKKLNNVYRPYGPKKGEYFYEDGTDKD